MRRSGLILFVALSACSGAAREATTRSPSSLPTARATQSIDSVQLEYTPCFGTCPIYSFLFRPTGSAVHVSEAYLPLAGRYEADFDSSSFAALEELILRKRILGMDPRYAEGMTDQSSRIITVWLPGTTKVVHEYGRAAPAAFHDVRRHLDSVGAHLAWRWVAPLPSGEWHPQDRR